MKKMKFYLLPILMILLSSAYAQDEGLTKLFKKYGEKDGVSVVNISSEMFSMMSDFDTGKNNDMDRIIKDLDGLKIITVEHKAAGVTAARFYDEVMSFFPAAVYKEIMTVNDKDDNVVFLARKKNGKMQELIMIASDKEETAVMSFTGSLMLSDFSKLSKSLKIEGMEKLEDIQE